MTGIQVKAGGNISPARFVKLSTAANSTVLQAAATNVALFGVSTEALKNAPQTGGSVYAAEANDEIRIYTPGTVCLLELGVGGTTAGNFLKPDANGAGVTAATTDVAGAQAMETASAGELCLVYVTPPLYVK